MSVTEDVPFFLQGNGAPVQERTVTELTVTGTIPPELDGRYLRNGGNPVTGMCDHLFLGDGMVHGVRLRDGRAEWYRNRYVRTPFVENPDMQAVDPNVMMDMRSSKANTNIVGHAGKFLALEEGHFPYVLNGELETVGTTDYDGRLTGPFTAHPKICPHTGEMIGFGYWFMEPYLTYHRVSADGQLVQTHPITVGGPTMMHDFNITRNYVIFMDLPAVFDLEAAIRGEMPIHWDDDYPARLGVMARDGDDASVRWFEIDPCYVFHPMNAYEEGTTIVVDVARLDYIWRDGPMDFPPATLWRWTIDLASGTVRQDQVDDWPAEFPRVADAVVGTKHRYGYMLSGISEDAFKQVTRPNGSITKYDRETGERTVLEMGDGRTPGESVFVPAEGATAEDDGYLMTYVYDTDSNSSEFVIIDAATMSSDFIARVQLPRVPFGFHGNWVPATVAD